MTNNKIITIAEPDFPIHPLPTTDNKFKKGIWIGLGLALVIFLGIIYWQSFPPSPTNKKSIELSAGEYTCNIYSPQKKNYRIIVSQDTQSPKILGTFINYAYPETLYSSEFIVKVINDSTQVRNSVLGTGTIKQNSRGDIEITSTPENEQKWSMRKK